MSVQASGIGELQKLTTARRSDVIAQHERIGLQWLNHFRRGLDELLGHGIRPRAIASSRQKYKSTGGKTAHSQQQRRPVHTRTQYAVVTRGKQGPAKPNHSTRVAQRGGQTHRQSPHVSTRYRTVTATKHPYRPTAHRVASPPRTSSLRKYKPPTRTYTRYHTVTLHHASAHRRPLSHRTTTRTVTQRHTVTKHPPSRSPKLHRPPAAPHKPTLAGHTSASRPNAFKPVARPAVTQQQPQATWSSDSRKQEPIRRPGVGQPMKVGDLEIGGNGAAAMIERTQTAASRTGNSQVVKDAAAPKEATRPTPLAQTGKHRVSQDGRIY